MTAKPYVIVIAGEAEPFLSKSKLGYQRLMEAIVKTGSSLRSSFSLTSWNEKGDFQASLEIPVKNITLFRKLAKCSLSYGPDIRVGRTVSSCAKWVDESNVYHDSPHPEVLLNDEQ